MSYLPPPAPPWPQLDEAPLPLGPLRLGAIIAAGRVGEAQRALHTAFVAG